jgi:hypothetical protein
MELDFGDSPTVFGEGSFGILLLAESCGTKVAVKHVLASRPTPGRKIQGSKDNSNFSSQYGLGSPNTTKVRFQESNLEKLEAQSKKRNESQPSVSWHLGSVLARSHTGGSLSSFSF